MTSLMMLPGMAEPTPQTINSVTQQVSAPQRDDGPAEMDRQPDFNEPALDSSPELVGLHRTTVAGDTHDGSGAYTHYPSWWSPLVSDQNHNAIVDDQVSSAGTAAAREEAGEQGHGPIIYTVSIDPIIRDGNACGSDYFAANNLDANQGSRNEMGSPVMDIDWMGVAQSLAIQNSRDAFSGLYDPHTAQAAGVNG